MAEPLESPGKLNHTFLVEQVQAGDLSSLKICRHCLKPTQTDGRIVVCPGCDLIERTTNG